MQFGISLIYIVAYTIVYMYIFVKVYTINVGNIQKELDAKWFAEPGAQKIGSCGADCMVVT